MFANGLGDRGSIPGHVIPKTLKMVLDTSLLNTQQYKVRIKGKVEQSRERSSTLPYTYTSRSYWKGSLLVVIDNGCQLICINQTRKIPFFKNFLLWFNCWLKSEKRRKHLSLNLKTIKIHPCLEANILLVYIHSST